MNRKYLYIILGGVPLTVLFGTLIFGLFFASNPNEIPSALVNKKAPAFSITTYDGEKISLDQLKGKPVILNFWASWCVPCRQEAADLEEMHQKYTPKGAVFIGIAFNDERSDSIKFLQRYGQTFFTGPDETDGTFSLEYGVTGIPETFYIDKQGFIRVKILGVVSIEGISEFLDKELEGTAL